MPYTITHLPHKNYIMSKITGELSAKLIDDCTVKLARIIQQTQCLRVLNDLRKATRVNVSATFLFNLYKLFSKYYIPPATRCAIIIPENSSLDQDIFQKDTSRSQGQSIRFFTDTQAAEDWLMGRGA